MPTDSETLRAFKRYRHLALFLLACAGTVLTLGILLAVAYRDAEAQAETLARNAASILEAQINSTLRRLQADLEGIAATTPPRAMLRDQAGLHAAAVNAILAGHARHFPEVGGYRIMDFEGRPLYSSPSDTALPEPGHGFRGCELEPGQGLAFSQVVAAGDGSRPLLFAAVPISGAGGKCLGFAAAAIELGYFQRLFNALDLGSDGVVTFRRSDDGRLVLRRPERPGTVNRTLQNNPMHMRVEAGERDGVIRYVAQIDRVERVYAFRRVGDYPFYVASGVASADFLSTWRSMALSASLAVAVVLLLFAAVTWRLKRLAADGQRLADELLKREATYRSLLEGAPFPVVIAGREDAGIRYLNHRALAWLDAGSGELLGRSERELFAQPESRDRLLALLRDEGSVRDAEVEMRQRAGGRCWAMVSMQPVDFEGEPAVFSAYSDISERKAAELAMAAANSRLQAQLDESGRLQAALEELAVRDGLTGLYNRRYLDETLEREVSRARRDGSPLSLIMIDIDHFKRVNDVYGHQAGDLVLRALGRLLADEVRAQDLPCRYGGEEFLVLLPGMPLDAASARAEEWRREVEDISVRFGSFDLRVTASFGVAAYPDHAKTPDELIRCADRALYAAKEAGRNRVEVLVAA